MSGGKYNRNKIKYYVPIGIFTTNILFSQLRTVFECTVYKIRIYD